jgi:hypothetical protein
MPFELAEGRGGYLTKAFLCVILFVETNGLMKVEEGEKR